MNYQNPTMIQDGLACSESDCIIEPEYDKL